MPEGQEDDKPVPVGIAGLACRSQQFLDFPLSQVFPDPVIGILAPPGTVGFSGIGALSGTMVPMGFSSGFQWQLSVIWLFYRQFFKGLLVK